MSQLKINEGKATIKTDPKRNYALRIFKGKEQVDYKSTRLGTLEAENDGISFDCPEEIVGLDYELKGLGKKIEVISKGKIESTKIEQKKTPEKPEENSDKKGAE